MYSSATTPDVVDRSDVPPRKERSPYSVMLRALGTLLTLPTPPQVTTRTTSMSPDVELEGRTG